MRVKHLFIELNGSIRLRDVPNSCWINMFYPRDTINLHSFFFRGEVQPLINKQTRGIYLITSRVGSRRYFNAAVVFLSFFRFFWRGQLERFKKQKKVAWLCNKNIHYFYSGVPRGGMIRGLKPHFERSHCIHREGFSDFRNFFFNSWTFG